MDSHDKSQRRVECGGGEWVAGADKGRCNEKVDRARVAVGGVEGKETKMEIKIEIETIL